MRSSLTARLDGILRRTSGPAPGRAPPGTFSVDLNPAVVLPAVFLPAVEYRRFAPRRVDGSGCAASPRNGSGIEAVIPGEEISAPHGGRAWRVRSTSPADGTPALPEGALVLDIETTGLSSFPLFLVGVLSPRGAALEVRQYLARDYSEERAVVSLFLDEAERAISFLSFNGRSYDLPYLRSRAVVCGLPPHADRPHRDLLHESRRAFGDRLPDCRLGTIEAGILRRPRHDDLPGSEVPAVYHQWVRTGDARPLARVMQHNRRDLLSLAALLAVLGG